MKVFDAAVQDLPESRPPKCVLEKSSRLSKMRLTPRKKTRVRIHMYSVECTRYCSRMPNLGNGPAAQYFIDMNFVLTNSNLGYITCKIFLYNFLSAQL